MGHYGYRLFLVRARDGMGRKNLDFGNIANKHFVDILHQDISDNIDETLKLEDPPKILENGSSAPPTGSVVRFTAIDRKELELRLDFFHGPFGEGGTLIDPEGEDDDQDVEGRALSNPYRAILWFPRKGTAGILAVEARGRACPYRRILASLKYIHSTTHRLFVEAGVADKAAVAHFIRNGVVRELEVTSHGTARDGDVLTDRVKMVVKISGASKLQEKMREKALQWANVQWKRLTNQDARRALAKELTTTAVGVTIPLDFDDSLLRIDGPNDRKRTLRPSRDVGEWIYDIADYRLDDDKWFAQVSASIAEIFPTIAASEGVVPPS
ncbi:hypothetical protein ACIBJE_07125 [Micromonospora sp. NPDC050187]|uniref:hypothetical protein n=1 Tax=Micromonospora sp. NPDC050187 TaxID=3364277 RepID=UPI0037A406D3